MKKFIKGLGKTLIVPAVVYTALNAGAYGLLKHEYLSINDLELRAVLVINDRAQNPIEQIIGQVIVPGIDIARYQSLRECMSQGVDLKEAQRIADESPQKRIYRHGPFD